MSRPPSVLTNAAAVPVISVKGATASSSSILQTAQIFCRLDDDAGDAEWRRGNVVVLDRLEPPDCRSFLGENRVGGGVDLIEIGGADELLEQGDVRVVCRVQREAPRIGFEQAGVVGLGLPNHRRVRF